MPIVVVVTIPVAVVIPVVAVVIVVMVVIAIAAMSETENVRDSHILFSLSFEQLPLRAEIPDPRRATCPHRPDRGAAHLRIGVGVTRRCRTGHRCPHAAASRCNPVGYLMMGRRMRRKVAGDDPRDWAWEGDGRRVARVRRRSG